MYEDDKIDMLVPLDTLDIDSEVKQLFIDVFHKDPNLRPGAIELLNQPIISFAVEYGRYFDECYDSEDAEDLEASPALECEDYIPIADIPQHISLTSSGSQISLHSMGDEVGELPQISSGQKRIYSHSQYNELGITMKSSHSDSSKLLDQDSGLEDKIDDKHSELDKHTVSSRK